MNANAMEFGSALSLTPDQLDKVTALKSQIWIEEQVSKEPLMFALNLANVSFERWLLDLENFDLIHYEFVQ